jgi:hypothetical protein
MKSFVACVVHDVAELRACRDQLCCALQYNTMQAPGGQAIIQIYAASNLLTLVGRVGVGPVLHAKLLSNVGAG